MINKQLLNVIMLGLGFALVANPSTNSMNAGLVQGLTWLVSGIGKKLK